MKAEPEKFGRGSGLFRLGTGPDATGGNVEIELRCVPAAAPVVFVEWLAPHDSVPPQARQQTLAYIERYLRGYMGRNPVGALHVSVVGAGWFADRHNEPERAAWIALHHAIVDAELPPPPLYAPPTDADL